MPPEMKEAYPQRNAVVLTERKPTVSGEFTITPFYVPHNGIANYAYIIKCGEHRIAWMTDLEYCPYILKNQNLTAIFCECNYQADLVDRDLPQYTHKLRGHLSLDSCVKLIETNKTDSLKTVLLLHLGHDTAIPSQCIAEVQKVANCPVYVAEKGLQIELKGDEPPF